MAKTISAYDKIVSDEIYGAGTRYVSKERLVAMLDWEYAHVADPFWDLAGWCANTDLPAESQWRLLSDYGGSPPASGDWQRLRLTGRCTNKRFNN